MNEVSSPAHNPCWHPLHPIFKHGYYRATQYHPARNTLACVVVDQLDLSTREWEAIDAETYDPTVSTADECLAVLLKRLCLEGSEVEIGWHL